MLLKQQSPSASRTGARIAWRLASPVCQVLGAATILAGCCVFLPKFSLATPPKTLLGVSAPDLGNDLFQAGAVLYFVGAVLSIAQVAPALRDARAAGRSALPQCASLCAFGLFVATSCLFFANGRLPTARAVEAGYMRLAAALCMMGAIVLLLLVAVADTRSPRTTTAREAEPMTA